MPGIDPISGAITLASALGTALTAGGSGDKNTAINDLLKQLSGDKSYIGSTAFSKDELFNNIFPQLKKMLMGASDVAAGRIGSALGETGADMGGGQNFGQYYTEALAPVIAQGQQQSAGALQGLTDLFSTMDSNAKNRLLNVYQLGLGGANQMEDTNPLQRMFLGFLQGGNLGSNALGSLAMADYYKNKDAGSAVVPSTKKAGS